MNNASYNVGEKKSLKKRLVKFLAWSLGGLVALLLALFVMAYIVYEYKPLAKVGSIKISRHYVKQEVPKYETYLKKIKGTEADLPVETFKVLLEEKAAEHKANELGLVATEAEITEEVEKVNEEDNLENLYARYKTLYGWDESELKRQIKIRILKEKLEKKIVDSYNVSFLFTRSDAEPKEGESKEQVKLNAKRVLEEAREQVAKGENIHAVARKLEASSKTWSDTASNSGDVVGLNEQNEKQKLINKNYWPAIKKLKAANDQTEVMDLTDQGGLYIFWVLNSQVQGQYSSMEEFYAGFKEEAWYDKYLNKLIPQALAACNNWLNENVNTADEIAHYRVSTFEIQVRDSVTRALITPNDSNVKIRLVNVEPADGHCDATWCLMNRTDTMSDGADGQTTFGDTCCQFTYAVYVDNLRGYSYSYTDRRNIDGPDSTTTAYPPHFNANNGVDNMYGDMYYSPQYSLSVSINGTGAGKLTTPGGAIDCTYSAGSQGGTCSHTYTANGAYDSTSLIAQATDGKFIKFEGGGCSTSPCSLTMSSNISVSATFDRDPVVQGLPSCWVRPLVATIPAGGTTTLEWGTDTPAVTTSVFATWTTKTTPTGSQEGIGVGNYSMVAKDNAGHTYTCPTSVQETTPVIVQPPPPQPPYCEVKVTGGYEVPATITYSLSRPSGSPSGEGWYIYYEGQTPTKVGDYFSPYVYKASKPGILHAHAKAYDCSRGNCFEATVTCSEVTLRGPGSGEIIEGAP